MLRLAALLAAVLPHYVRCQGVVYPADNTRITYRSDSTAFYDVWPNPALMQNGSGLLTDMTIHSQDVTTKEAWADYLYPLPAEQYFVGNVWSARTRRLWWTSYAAAILYVIGLWWGTAAMRDRKPFDLRSALSLWNLSLAVFSIVGTARTLPHLIMLLRNYGFEYTICRAGLASYGNGPTGVWVKVFALSKFIELVDTAFLVLRKRKVGFLHWYHHCSVLIYTWHATCWETPTGIYFVTMNYTVHALMYTYYFLAATTSSPPKWGLLVTVMQLVQMFFGIIVNLQHLNYMVFTKMPLCDGHMPTLMAALGMYASYLFLFAQFFCRRYCLKRDGAKKVA